MFAVPFCLGRTERVFGRTDVTVSDIWHGFPVSQSKKGLTFWNPLRSSLCCKSWIQLRCRYQRPKFTFCLFSCFLSPKPLPLNFVGWYPWGFLQRLQKKWAVADVWHMFTCLSPGLSGPASENHSQGHVDLSQMSRPGIVWQMGSYVQCIWRFFGVWENNQIAWVT